MIAAHSEYRRIAASLPLLLLAACATASRGEAPCPRSRGWHAWIDILPGPREDLGLFVSGEIDVPAGFSARLKPGPLEKSLPPGQPFALKLKRGGDGPARQIVTGRVRSNHSAYREIAVYCGDTVIARIDGQDVETAD